MARRLTLCVVLLEATETDEPSGVIETAGTELVRARPIRTARVEPVDAFPPGSALSRLEGWFRFGRRAS